MLVFLLSYPRLIGISGNIGLWWLHMGKRLIGVIRLRMVDGRHDIGLRLFFLLPALPCLPLKVYSVHLYFSLRLWLLKKIARARCCRQWP